MWGPKYTLDSIEREDVQRATKWPLKEESQPPRGGSGPWESWKYTNPYAADFVANRAPGIRESVPDPTALYVVPPSFATSANPVRPAPTITHQRGIFAETPTMLRRNELLYDILFTKNYQGPMYSDYGTFAVPESGFNLGRIRPYSPQMHSI